MKYKLGDFCTFRYGKMPLKAKFSDNKDLYPIYSGYRTAGFYDEYNIEAGELIVVARGVGGTGDVKLTPEKCYLTNLSIAVAVDENLALKKYLYYYFQTKNLRYLDSGSAQSQITISDLQNVRLALPSIEDQGVIVATLSALDDKIDNNTKTNYSLEQIVQAIFKSWFVDFEPFANEEFIDSELGEIPAGWSVQTIEYLADKVAMGPFGSNIKVETFVESGVPIISGNHLRGLYLGELGYNFITEEHARRLSNSLVRAGDIIFTHAGNIGQVALIPDDCDYPYYVISQRQFYLRCDKTKALPEYVNYFFHSHEGQGKLLANASQTGVPSIARPSSHLKGIPIVLPPIEVQLKWFEAVRAMLQSLNCYNKESKRLATVRDSLLAALRIEGKENINFNWVR